MSEIETILAEATSRGVALWIDADQLRFRAPPGVLTDDFRAMLNTRKAELICTLRQFAAEESGRAPGPSFLRRPQPWTLPIIQYHRQRWAAVQSGNLGLEFTNCTHCVFRFHGRLDQEALSESVRALMARHSILSAHVIDGIRGPEFIFEPYRATPLAVVDVSKTTVGCTVAAAQAAAHELIWARFAPGEPWIRIFVIRLDEADFVIGFVVHHFICDGWSIGIIRNELLRAYVAFAAGKQPTFQEPRMQYSDYVTGINEWLNGPGPQRDDSYWQAHLCGAPPTRICPDLHAEDSEAATLEAASQSIAAQSVLSLRNVGRSAGVSMHSLVLAALAADVAHSTGQNDLVIVSRVHGRHNPATFGVVGAFFDAVALRISFSMNATFIDLARQVHETCARSTAHQYYPYQLVKSSLPHGTSDLGPMLNFREAANEVDRGDTPSGIVRFDLPPRPPVMHTALRFSNFNTDVTIDSTGLHATTEYLGILYHRDTVTRFVQTLCGVLARGACAPDRTWSTLLTGS